MIERDKQVTDQQKKQAQEKQHEEQKKHPRPDPQQQHAGQATDPKTANDKGYAERIEDKTSKH